LLDALAHEGKPAITALAVEVREVFHQRVRALRRGAMWDPEQFVGADFPRISSTPESEYDGKLY
jgi:predicted pyridoxine 5'-phosphate oxidase superfamily flavin-nucleotide-binding protein